MIINAILFLSMLTVSLACNKQNKTIPSKPVESIQNPEINMQAKKTSSSEKEELDFIEMLMKNDSKKVNVEKTQNPETNTQAKQVSSWELGEVYKPIRDRTQEDYLNSHEEMMIRLNPLLDGADCQ